MLIVQESNSNDELLDRLKETKCVTMGHIISIESAEW